MVWIFAVVGLLLVVALGLVVVGRETARLAGAPRPAVFDLAQATDLIADWLPPESQARLTHDDVRWILLADADLLEDSTRDLGEGRFPWSRVKGVEVDRPEVVDEDAAVARVLAAAERSNRDLLDEDVAAVLAGRMRYLDQIGAVGTPAEAPTVAPPAPPADGSPAR